MQTDVNTTEELEYGFRNKRRRVATLMSDSTIAIQDQDYEDGNMAEYDYDAEYDCGSVISDTAYSGEQQPSLAEVLNYCQAMYDIVQKLDKKMDLLQRKVSEMHHAWMKRHLKPENHNAAIMRSVSFPRRVHHPSPQVKIRLHKFNQRVPGSQIPQPPRTGPNHTLQLEEDRNQPLQGSSSFIPVPAVPLQREHEQTLQRLSPPLPTIVSTHSLQPIITVTDDNHKDVRIESLPESTCASPPIINTSLAASSRCEKPSSENIRVIEPVLVPCPVVQRNTITSEELPSSSVQPVPIYEFLGDPSRNLKVPGSFLAKARQKTRPKYAARYLVRALFPKVALLTSAVVPDVQGLMALDKIKVSAIREFLATTFPECDLGEYGKDWKTCTTNVNAMIRCLHLETRKQTANQIAPKVPEDSICLDSDDAAEDDNEVQAPEDSQKIAQKNSFAPSTTVNKGNESREQGIQATGSLVKQQSSDPIETFGEPWRNVHLPFSVIYMGKGKPRPELSARYLIRHLFSEDVLIKSNVYGSLERGVLQLDGNKIGALRDFLQLNYPTFDLRECGHDWKACVAAINSTIRSLRHDQKKASLQTKRKT